MLLRVSPLSRKSSVLSVRSFCVFVLFVFLLPLLSDGVAELSYWRIHSCLQSRIMEKSWLGRNVSNKIMGHCMKWYADCFKTVPSYSYIPFRIFEHAHVHNLEAIIRGSCMGMPHNCTYVKVMFRILLSCSDTVLRYCTISKIRSQLTCYCNGESAAACVAADISCCICHWCHAWQKTGTRGNITLKCDAFPWVVWDSWGGPVHGCLLSKLWRKHLHIVRASIWKRRRVVV